VLFGHVRRWRLDNPSRHERAVMAILEDLGCTDYEREALPLGEGELVAVDLCFWERRRIIEVNSRVHYDPLFDHPNAPHTRRENDARRQRKLERAGWEVLEIDYRELVDMAAARQRVAAFLGLAEAD
jgi:hypothetical protein